RAPPAATLSPSTTLSRSAPTKFNAASVGTTRTLSPCSLKLRTTCAALYAAIPPATPTTILRGRACVSSGVWPAESAVSLIVSNTTDNEQTPAPLGSQDASSDAPEDSGSGV